MMRGSLMILRLALLLVALLTQVECSVGQLTRLLVRSVVDHRYASTHLLATLNNQRPHPHHLTLTLILPKDAYVSSLTIETGGRNYTTEVKARKRGGRRGHHDNDTQQATPPSGDDRWTQDETQKFKAGTMVDALGSATFYLSYEQLLLRFRGSYTHTIYLPPHSEGVYQEVEVVIRESQPIRDFQLLNVPRPHPHAQMQEEAPSLEEVRVTYILKNSDTRMNQSNAITNNPSSNNKSNIISSSSRDDQDREQNVLSMTYDVQREVDGGEIQLVGRFFVHYFSPEGLPKLPTHTVFVLDVSGSMHDFGKLAQLKLAMEAILRSLPPEDSFEVLVFSSRVTSLGVYRATPKDVEKGVGKIHRLQALGGTNFNEALLQAVLGANAHNATHGTAKQVVFLTDGKPNLGETRSDQLRRNVREANIYQLPIFSLALGHDADLRLLRQVSADNYGFTRKIDQEDRPAQQLQDFYQQIASPLMTDVDILYLEDEVDQNSLVRQGPTTYYSGDEVVVSGQLAEGATEVHPIVEGRGKGGPLQLQVSRISTPEPAPQRDNYVERLWAYLTVLDLLAVQEIVDDRNLREEMRARAKEIAIEFKFVTKLTKLEVVNPEQGDVVHPGLKSASRHHKSKTGGHASHQHQTGGHAPQLHHDLALLSVSEFAKTLPQPLSSRIHTSASNHDFSFSDNDPHFVVQVPGLHLPLCFDIHGSPGHVLSLVRDPHSGIVVNGLVEAALGRADATYFTVIFISVGSVNFTITPTSILVDCLNDAGHPTVDSVSTSLWPFKKMNLRKRSGRRGKKHQGKRKSLKRLRTRRRRSHNQTKNPQSGSSQVVPNTQPKSRKLKYRRLRPRKHNMNHNRFNITRRRQRRHINSIGRLHSIPLLTQNLHGSRHSHSECTHIYPRPQMHPHAHRNHIHPQRHPLSVGNLIQPLVSKNSVTVQESESQSQEERSDYSVRNHLNSHHTSHLKQPRRYHPQARSFIHPQSRVNLNPPSLEFSGNNLQENTISRPGDLSNDLSASNIHSEDQDTPLSNDQATEAPLSDGRHTMHGGTTAQTKEDQLLRECSKTFSWKKAAGRRYGEVVVALRNHRKLDLLLGDVEANLLVTRTKNKRGQYFLGFYLENHSVLSPNTTGIIGQFAYKTVGTVDLSSSSTNTSDNTPTADKVRLAVVQPGPTHRYQVSQVNAFLSSRRSLLHKTHVTCLYIRQQGRGLVAGTPEDYLLPCLTC
nr:inter-alpha-trypsin inhibitor heavy chain H1-like isoform X2 [Cherax quadricarinatus]